MVHIEPVLEAAQKPSNLPPLEDIVSNCPGLLAIQKTPTNLHGVKYPLVKKADDDPTHVWVKFGRYITMDEAKTQNYVVQVLDKKDDAAVKAPRVYLAFNHNQFGYIVMEFIEGQVCEKSDAQLIAAALESLVSIKSPFSQPGPVGGGCIKHPFFVERTSPIPYETIEELEQHINGVSVLFYLVLSHFVHSSIFG